MSQTDATAPGRDPYRPVGGDSLPAPLALPRRAEDDNGKEAALAALTDEVYERIGNPVDAWAVVATLESRGWRDRDAQEQFFHADLFDLGQVVYRRCKKRVCEAAPLHEGDPDAGAAGAWNAAGRFVRYYGQGLLFAALMVGQMVVLLWTGYSLWAWLYFSGAQATVVALGTIGSFLVTGGFIQAIGREGTRHLGAGNGRLAMRSCYRLVGLGMATAIAFGGTVFVLNLLFPFYPLPLMSLSAMYFVLLSGLWLLLAVLYVMERLLAILVITLLGVVPVYMVMEWTSGGIYAAHAVGLAAANLMTAAYGLLCLRRRARSGGPAQSSVEPRRAVAVHTLAPYFGYGVLYFAFFFTDRIVAWSVSGPDGELPPYFIWFRTGYELGMDWALLSMSLTLAMLHYTVHNFAHRLLPELKGTHGLDLEALNGRFQRFYWRHVALLLGTGVVSIVATYFGVQVLEQAGVAPRAQELLFSGHPATSFVFWCAAASYLFVALGLMNVLFFFVLARPRRALRALVPAYGVNLVVGLLLSRWLGHEFAVLGLLAGAVVFAGYSTRSASRFFDRFDYFYYSAY